jgi:hypothetical protein
MIPGLVSRSSEKSLALVDNFEANVDLIRISSTATTTQFASIMPKSGTLGQMLCLSNESGATINALTTGNILAASSLSLPASKMTILIYSKGLTKWIPNISA